MIDSQDVIAAHQRIKDHLHRTPIISSTSLNEMLGGHEIYFKLECHQRIGAFKSRGAFNKIIHLIEQNKKPKSVVAVSSGNHAQGIALACKTFAIPATIFMNKSVSPLKIQATKSYGAEVILVESNQEADQKAAKAEQDGAFFIHPFDDDDIIAGQGTAAYEALSDLDDKNLDALFVPCGGGGLLSGSFLATQLFDKETKVIAGEPANCNDAAISLKQDKLHIFDTLPITIADGIRTLSISERTFSYLKQTGGIEEITEEEIIYWTQWSQHLLKISCEPSSAVAMAACYKWLKKQTAKQQVLVIISGGNVSSDSQKKIWETDFLHIQPSLTL